MEKVLKTWLSHMCGTLPGAQHALLIAGPPGQGPFELVSSWPGGSSPRAVLDRIARTALHMKKVVVKTRSHAVENAGEPLDTLACPLFLDGRLVGVAAVAVTHRSEQMHRALVRRVQSAAKWLETMLRLDNGAAREQLGCLVELVAAGLDPERFRMAATAVTGELADRFCCHRVSLGFLRFNRVRLETLSQASRSDMRSNLAGAIRDAMSECLDQGATVVYPEPPDVAATVTRFHARLAKMQPGASILTLPLVKNGEAVGALTLERTAEKPFSAESVSQCEQIGLLLGPVLETRRSEERSLAAKVSDSVRSGLGSLLGPRRLGLKTAAALGLVLLAWLVVAEGTFRISSDTVLEPGIRRAIVAPQQGYIAEAHVRAGDLVRKGDSLATLDDRELRLEQHKWQGLRAQLLEEYRKALAGLNRAEVAILKARRVQAEARLKLVQRQLERTTLVAPFSGLVVKGDLSQALGSPVERGQVLYEVAPNGAYRAVLKVDDRDIGLVRSGQRGWLKLAGVPDRSIGIRVERVTPLAISQQGRNFFRVEAAMDSQSDLMRPGMEGIAKIEIERRNLLGIWTRRLVDWLRLSFWLRLS